MMFFMDTISCLQQITRAAELVELNWLDILGSGRFVETNQLLDGQPINAVGHIDDPGGVPMVSLVVLSVCVIVCKKIHIVNRST